MAYEMKEGSGALFKNDRKEKDTHPDYTGSIMVNGTEHYLSAWLNKSKSGTNYMSVSIGKVKGGPSNQSEAPNEDFSSDIPF